MQYGSAVLDGLSAQPLLGHGVINLLDVRAAQSLQLDGADLWFDVILDTGLIVKVCCRLDLIGGKGIEPFIKPLCDCRLLWCQICTAVNFTENGRHLLTNGGLRVSVNAAADRLSCARVIADGHARFPSTVRPLPDAAGTRCSARICFSWHCFFLLHLL